ncbi:MAG: glycosyl hydrolase [Mesorhizobium sp.]|nr:MAG: glycosyl hydrolase [Mesorhizobium sp.]
MEYNTSRLASLENEILALDRERQALQSTIAEIYRSTSWRASAPIRFIKQRVSSLKRLVSGQRGWQSNFEKERQPEADDDIQEVNYAAKADCPAFAALSRLPEQQAAAGAEVAKDDAKLIAFYLPQYHRIPENSEWWGNGFTEWTNVARAKPNFEGHHQPHIPRDLGYYDLSHPDTMREQAELAKLYGVHGFCFYHYWFSGRRVLEKPVNNFLNSDIEINFCLCWANENWTRTWDGNSKSILLEQLYADGDAEAFIDSLIDSFRDRRYINISGEPLLVVYRAKDIPDPKRWFKIWRERVQDRGFPGLHIAVVDFYDISTPDEVGADSLVEFPPHKFNGPQSHPSIFPTITNPDFAGGIVDYAKVIAQSANRSAPSFKLFRGIMPGWDNTARRQNTPTIVVNACPDLYGAWLSYLRDFTRRTASDASERLIFINAWNEWGEGCYLEPDQRWGYAYLEQTLKSAYFEIGSAGSHSLESERVRLLTKTSEIVVSGNLNCKLPVFETASQSHNAMVENVAAELSAYRPPGDFARRISAALVKWPLLHTIAKKGYISLQRFRG